MERKIGETFVYKERCLKVILGSFCDDCYWYGKECWVDVVREKRGNCSVEGRDDGNSVIFKLIGDKK